MMHRATTATTHCGILIDVVETHLGVVELDSVRSTKTTQGQP